MNKAHNLEDAINNLDPLVPLGPDDAAFFVERGHSQRQEMGKRLRLMVRAGRGYARFLFTGHRGSGKGTELGRLEKELEDAFLVSHYSVAQKLDVSDLEYTDVVFSVGMAVLEAVQKTPAIANRIPDELLTPILKFYADISVESTYKEGYDSGLELKPSILNILTGYARLGTERSSRKVIREQISGSLRALVQAIDDLARYIERETNKKILVMVEDLDKADLEKARALFHGHGKSLSDIPVHLIYTFPIALRHSQDFKQVVGVYFDSFDLPNIKTHTRDDQPVPEGLACLREIVTNRVSEGLFEVGSLELLTEKSGGLARSLISLANEACLQAILQNRTKVKLENVQSAVKNDLADSLRILTQEQLGLLRQIRADKKIDNTAPFQALLYNLSVLEYRNDEPIPWYDVHPVLWDAL